MVEYGISLTRIFSYKDRIKDFIRQYTGQRKPVLWYILRSVYFLCVGFFGLNLLSYIEEEH